MRFGRSETCWRRATPGPFRLLSIGDLKLSATAPVVVGAREGIDHDVSFVREELQKELGQRGRKPRRVDLHVGFFATKRVGVVRRVVLSARVRRLPLSLPSCRSEGFVFLMPIKMETLVSTVKIRHAFWRL